MKKIKNLLVGIAIVFPLLSYSQSINLGLKGGVTYNTFAKHSQIDFTDAKGGMNPFAGVKAFIDIQKIQIGIGVDRATMSHEYKSAVPYTSNQQEYYLAYDINVPMYPVYAFANYTIRLPRSYAYVGVNAGHIFFGKKEDNSVSYSPELTPTYGSITVGAETPESTLFGGIQGGYNISITKGFSVNGEIGISYVPIKAGFNSHDFALHNMRYVEDSYFLYIPLSVGVNYTF